MIADKKDIGVLEIKKRAEEYGYEIEAITESMDDIGTCIIITPPKREKSKKE